LPVKNYTTSIFPEYERFDGKNLRTTFKTKPRSCHSCPLAHCHFIEVSEGPYKGLRCEEPEYELWAGWGPNIGNTDPNAVVKLNDLTDRLGMDGNEASYLVSMVMECFEKGIVTSKDTDGIELTWGNVSGVISLIESMARRKGIGDILAEGVMRAARKIGKGAEECAIYVKQGSAPQGLDLRGAWGLLFTHAVSTIGSWEGYFLERGTIPELGFKEPIPAWSEEWVPKAAARTGCKRQFEESIGCCIFVSRESIQIYLNTINALTGRNLDVEEMLKIGKRIITLNRAFAIRQGCSPEDDGASPRILNAAKDGPAMDRSIAPSLETMKKAYYAELGWDENTSKPLPETLRALGLDEVIKDLW
jgi:aldehyde:ferredoxin oxidoreductase